MLGEWNRPEPTDVLDEIRQQLQHPTGTNPAQLVSSLCSASMVAIDNKGRTLLYGAISNISRPTCTTELILWSAGLRPSPCFGTRFAQSEPALSAFGLSRSEAPTNGRG